MAASAAAKLARLLRLLAGYAFPADKFADEGIPVIRMSEINCGALSHTDVRAVDDSLFGRPHVLAVRPRQSRARTEVSITTRRHEAASLNERTLPPEPIFIEFKSEEQLQYVRTLLHIYARPEIYGSADTIDTGGTHRFFRQLDITISDAKSIMPRWPIEDATTGVNEAAES